MGDEQKVEGDGYAEPIHGPLCSLLDGECVSCHCVKVACVRRRNFNVRMGIQRAVLDRELAFQKANREKREAVGS